MQVNCLKELQGQQPQASVMSRYYFRISNGKPHEDDVGEELRDEGEAWRSAKRLVRDIEDTLEPGGKWVVEVRDANGPLYLISINGRRLR